LPSSTFGFPPCSPPLNHNSLVSFKNFLNGLLGAIAQFETELRAERQLDGIKKARERGVHFGRTKQLTAPQILTLQRKRKKGVLIKTLMQEFALSKASVYRYLREAIPPASGKHP
jgi:DNA invertase Pin-like site-specific DNA recombinase